MQRKDFPVLHYFNLAFFRKLKCCLSCVSCACRLNPVTEADGVAQKQSSREDYSIDFLFPIFYSVGVIFQHTARRDPVFVSHLLRFDVLGGNKVLLFCSVAWHIQG